ncbi:FAD-binding protein [Rhodocytophaga aerolata]|uniref:FAD-binding protein n=1 Tax=Rhodocytophaga aerolata TaxID=455078 RepID=A0ABT8RCV9_9BACT|nr:FAD-dependent oxidoreductase [Rhodocytophaga aerolata]MDO1449942.1 FAD-binding protein [Rhodocytophaga aerolata]
MTLTDLKADIGRLKADLTGEVLTVEDTHFEGARAVWNAAVTEQPLLIVLPKNTRDVVKTVQFAQQHTLPLSVRGGGHDWAGRAITANGILINLRRMSQVEVNAGQKTALVQGGATGIEVSRATEKYKLVAVTPTLGEVGFTGWTLGGGYGPLSPSLGLGVDNVISAELVLADGTIRTASAQENPELFWAIRGGGGNFGVVTSLQVRLHEAKPLLSGMILFRESDAQVVLQKHNQLMATAPNELAVSAGMMFGPDGQPVVFLMPFWFGEQSVGKRYLEHMKQFAEPVQAQVGLMTYSDMLDFQSSFNQQGLHWVIQTRWLPSLEEDQIRILIQAVNQATSPRLFINMHHFHGAPTTVGENETPFPMRKPHYMVEIIAWEETKEAHNSQHYQQWASRVSEKLKNGAYPGGYANLLGPAETEQISQAYGQNLARLQQAKRTYDPGKVFNGIAIPSR